MYFQQPRTPGGSKPRTDFSLFLCSSSSSLSNPQDIRLESSSSKEILSSITVVSLDETKDLRNHIICKKNEDETNGSLTIIEVDSADREPQLEQWNKRNCDKQGEDASSTFNFSPNNSQNTEGSDACTTPGSLVWARKACHVWWPAEIVAERSTSVSPGIQGSNREVLVQYYGNQESTRIDPARDMSEFEDGFEERSCNPMDEFQEALKLALNQRGSRKPDKQFPSSPVCSNQPDGHKCNSSSSSRIKSDYLETSRRSKRKIKPKLHFDDVAIPLKSPPKKMRRRLKIMRSLGLAPPVFVMLVNKTSRSSDAIVTATCSSALGLLLKSTNSISWRADRLDGADSIRSVFSEK